MPKNCVLIIAVYRPCFFFAFEVILKNLFLYDLILIILFLYDFCGIHVLKYFIFPLTLLKWSFGNGNVD